MGHPSRECSPGSGATLRVSEAAASAPVRLGRGLAKDSPIEAARAGTKGSRKGETVVRWPRGDGSGRAGFALCKDAAGGS